MSGTRAISTTSRRELSPSFFFFLQGKAPKEIHAILTETLACFLPGRAKDLSAPLYLLKAETSLHGHVLVDAQHLWNPFIATMRIAQLEYQGSHFLRTKFIPCFRDKQTIRSRIISQLLCLSFRQQNMELL